MERMRERASERTSAGLSDLGAQHGCHGSSRRSPLGMTVSPSTATPPSLLSSSLSAAPPPLLFLLFLFLSLPPPALTLCSEAPVQLVEREGRGGERGEAEEEREERQREGWAARERRGGQSGKRIRKPHCFIITVNPNWETKQKGAFYPPGKKYLSTTPVEKLYT